MMSFFVNEMSGVAILIFVSGLVPVSITVSNASLLIESIIENLEHYLFFNSVLTNKSSQMH